jgi:hypothetical protein
VGHPEHPQHLHGAVAGLGLAGGLAGLHGAGGGLGVDRVGLAMAAAGGSVGPVDLDHPLATNQMITEELVLASTRSSFTCARRSRSSRSRTCLTTRPPGRTGLPAEMVSKQEL